MATLREARRLALALPEAHEADHHGFPSFRVGTKIFATQPDGEHFHVMLGPDETDAAVGTAPQAFEELYWGKKLAGVRVTLAGADSKMLAELLAAAWRRKAPRKLVQAFDASRE